MLFTQFFIAGLVAAVSAKKRKPAKQAEPAFTKTLVSKCMTASGLQSVPMVATSTKAARLTTTMTTTSTSTPVVEVTPEPAIETTVECSTSTTTETASQVTDTLSITTTFMETETAWESSTAIETEWTTFTEVTTTTPTVMPSAGWTPISSEVSSKGKAPAKRDDTSDVALVRRANAPVAQIKNGELVLPPQQYPTRVQCINVVYIVYIKVKVATAPEASTITAATPTNTITSTYVLVETITEAIQDATATETISETSTISLTSTQWETSTVTSSTTTTSILPAATPYYAACAPENLLSSVSGAGISRMYGMSQQPLYTHTSVASAYDCCVLAVQGEYAGSSWFPGPAGWCQLAGAVGSCDATRESFQFGVTRGMSPAGGFVVSNGNCGSGRLVGR